MTDSLLFVRPEPVELRDKTTEMTTLLICKALFLGAINAAPVGPVGLLCFNKNVSEDRIRGLSSAAGMALAYGIVAIIVIRGLPYLTAHLSNFRTWFEIPGGILLLIVGFCSLRKPKTAEPRAGRTLKYLGDLSSSFALTLFNPVPFATFTVLLTAFEIETEGQSLWDSLLFSTIVAAGTIGFWIAVNALFHRKQPRPNRSWSKKITRITAVILMAIGAHILGSGLTAWVV